MTISPGRFPPLQTTYSRTVWVRMPCDTIAYDTVTRTARGSGTDAYVEHNCLAVARFKTSGTALTVELRADALGAAHGLGLYIDGVWNQTINYVAGDSHGYPVDITLPAGIDKTIEIYESAGLISATPLIGTWLQAVTGDVRAAPPQNVTRRLVAYGDSITVGYTATIQTKLGLIPIIRSHYPGRVAVEAFSSRRLSDEADLSVLAALLCDLTFDATTKQILIAIGTNDYGGNSNMAAFGVKYATLLDAIHARLPLAAIYCLTPLLRDSEGPNANGDTLADFRTTIDTVLAARSWARRINGGAINVTKSDGIHPTDAGFVQLETALRPELVY